MATYQGPDGRVSGLEISTVATPEPDQVCVRLGGELDIATAPLVADRIAALSHRGSDLVLDLRGLSFIDSSGLNLLLKLAAECTRDGWSLSLIPASDVVQRVFQLTRTEERLPFRSPPENTSACSESTRPHGRPLSPRPSFQPRRDFRV